VLRFGIRTVLESVVTLDAFMEASGALEAAAAARTDQPDLVVLHDALPGVTGIVATTMLRHIRPHARIVLMSDDVDGQHRTAALQAGADSLLSMAIDPGEFAVAIDGLIDRSSPPQVDILVAEAPLTSLPSPTELAVLDGITRGLTDKEIARRFHVGPDEVVGGTDSHLARLDVADRHAAARAALRLGLIDLRDQLPPPSSAPEFGNESAA
jgi:DNA-binding NarL/FixJ family response regulator